MPIKQFRMLKSLFFACLNDQMIACMPLFYIYQLKETAIEAWPPNWHCKYTTTVYYLCNRLPEKKPHMQYQNILMAYKTLQQKFTIVNQIKVSENKKER